MQHAQASADSSQADRCSAGIEKQPFSDERPDWMPKYDFRGCAIE